MVEFVKTIKFRLEDPFPWKEELIEEGMEESREIAEEVCKRMKSIPPYRWDKKTDPVFYGWVKDLRDDLSAQSAQEIVNKVREAFFAWKKEGYQGNAPQPQQFNFVVFHNQQVEYFESSGQFYVELSLIPYHRFYLPVHRSSYYRLFLSDIVGEKLDYGSAELHKQNGYYTLHQTVKREVELVEDPEIFIGVDLGIRNIAVVSVVDTKGDIKQVEFFSGDRLRHIGRKYHQRRKKLQRQGKIKRIEKTKDKERRIKEDAFHKVSREIVGIAKEYERPVIKMEDLKVIKRKASKSKQWNRVKFGWAFGKLQTMIEYKAEAEGIQVKYVNPKNTSQVHYKCGEKGERNGEDFYCPYCDEEVHSDFNGAMNIALAPPQPYTPQMIRGSGINEY